MSGHGGEFFGGRKHYEVSRSLIERFPDTILARMTSELGLVEPIFIERNGERFQYCLDYMRDGRVSVAITVSKDGIVKDLEYYGFEGIDPAAIEVCGTSRAATGCILSDAQKNLAEMRLRALCIRVADECVDSYLSSDPTSDVIVNLKPLEPHYRRSSVNESDYMKPNTWNNKGKDLLNESLAEFGFQIKCIQLLHRPVGSPKSKSYKLSVTTELMKEEA